MGQVDLDPPGSPPALSVICIIPEFFLQVNKQEEMQVGQVVEKGGPRQAIQVEIEEVHCIQHIVKLACVKDITFSTI